MKFFNYDNPIMSFLSKMADLFVLNLLSILFSIPIITMGAAITATHYTALKLRREEGHVFSCFWKSFRENLKQSTCIWIVFLLHSFILFWAYRLSLQMDDFMTKIIQGVIVSVGLVTALIYAWIMPLQSRFINPILITLKNAFYMSFKYILRTVLMMIINLLPIGLLVFIVFQWRFKGFGIWLLFGISVPIYWCALLYDKVFEKIEEQILENSQHELE